MSPPIVPIRERLNRWLVPDPETGCLLWTGALTSGYGRICIKHRNMLVHRVTWELANGPVPDGLELDHLCRNRACANVAHLEPVTHSENCRRGDVGKHPSSRKQRTHCKRGHLLDEANTYVMPNDGRRRCRTCKQAAIRAWNLAHRKGADTKT